MACKRLAQAAAPTTRGDGAAACPHPPQRLPPGLGRRLKQALPSAAAVAAADSAKQAAATRKETEVQAQLEAEEKEQEEGKIREEEARGQAENRWEMMKGKQG